MRRALGPAVATLLLLALATPQAAADQSHSHPHDFAQLDMNLGDPGVPPGVESRHYAPGANVDRGGRLVAHMPGSDAMRTVAGSGESSRLGVQAGEPTIGVTKKGTLFYQALDGGPVVMRSTDGGRKWKDVSPRIGDRKRHPDTLDPYLYTDPMTGRTFTYDFFFGCSEISYTDDEGETWTTTVANCTHMDHQNLFAGPPVNSPTVGYPNIVYTCSTQFGATIYSVAANCLKSLDGGLTYVPTGSAAYVTEAHDENDLGITGYCHGAIGHGFVGRDGTVYVPKGLCGQPWLAISHDEGATWERVQVADNGVPQTLTGVYEHETAVAADAKGNVYYFWISAKRQPFLAVSEDGGKKWSDPIPVGPPNVTESTLPKIDVLSPGKVAIAYYGSTNSPGPPFPQADDCKPDPASCFRALFFLNPPDPEKYRGVTWNGYLTVSTNALDAKPTFFTGTINDPKDPLVRGTCGPIRCKAVYDFIDVVIDRDGRPWAAYVDICLLECASPKGTTNQGNEGVVGTLKGAPSLK